jgi:hypothetical protein
MKLEGKDLLSITGLHRFVEDRLAGFTIELDEMTGEVLIRSGLTIDNDGLFVPLVVQSDDPSLEAVPFDRDKAGAWKEPGSKEYRTWFCNENGDWWGDSKIIYVLHEYDLPEGFDEDEIENDKFEDVIRELGREFQIPDLI